MNSGIYVIMNDSMTCFQFSCVGYFTSPAIEIRCNGSITVNDTPIPKALEQCSDRYYPRYEITAGEVEQ